MQTPLLEKLQKSWHGTFKSYMTGFFVSLILTSFAFFLTLKADYFGTYAGSALIVLGLLQAVIQLVFFLHIGQEARPYFETLALVFTLLILFIIVIGSLWIMYDLNGRMMPEMFTKEAIHD